MKAKLNGIIGIDNAMERKLGNIDTTKKFIEATRTSKDRKSLSQKSGISIHDITYWATQAELLRVNYMNAEEAVELIDAGIYSIEQLQKADKEELLSIIEKKNEARKAKTVLTEEKLSQLQHEKAYVTTPYEYDDIGSILQSNSSQQISRSTAKGIIDKYSKGSEHKIDEGIKYLENIKPTLPLPRTISGHVKIEDNSTVSSASTMSASGLLVSISGISNPAEDKEENEKDYSCYTDPDGNFTIAMPDKYNMQETITISISRKNDMTYAIAGQSSSHEVEFVKLASEVLKNEYLYTVKGEKKKAAEILDSVNEISEKSAKAKEIETDLYKLAYCEYAKADFEQKKENLEIAINAYKEIINEEVTYHIEKFEKKLDKTKTQDQQKLLKIKKDWELITQVSEKSESIEAKHIYREISSDPYEDVINMFPENCDLLKEKVEDYKKAKNALQKVNEGLDYIEELKVEYEKNNTSNSYFTRFKNKLKGKNSNDNDFQNIDEYAQTLYKQYDKLIADCQKKLNALPRINNNKDSQAIESSDMAAVENSIQIERYLLSFLSTPMDSEFEDDFVINQSDFEDSGLHPRALPSVKLMGDGKNEVYLPTDTAPSRMFNYTMVHRLVEPQLKKNGIKSTRNKLDKAVGIHQFKENLCDKQENLALASTLGIGYALNMHQAWVPDGFALGNLLYSLVLAPGEEQRLIIREHKEAYTVSDDANATDRIHDSYSNSQVDNETAAFNNAVSRYSTAHSDSAYSAQAKSSGKAKINFFQGIGASSSASSTNSGSSYANSNQRDSYDEASHAAQNFQTSIKTESERIASANRTSIRVATSEESEAVSSRIVANHNHSHVMTVQYWEVARRYRLETCIDGIELLLFVPLELIRFMPDKDDTKKEFSEYTLQIKPNSDDGNIANYNKENFEYRYKNILKYYDTIEPYVPVKYRSGLNLIKKFAALPYWGVQKISSTAQKYYVTITGGFCEFDNLTATIYFNNGSRPVQGILTELSTSSLKKADGRNPHTRKETIEAITNARRNKEGTASFAFTLPYTCSKEDISQIKIYNNISSWKYTLSKASSDMDASEQEAVNKYEQIFNFNKNYKLQQILLAFYSQSLPECYSNPEVSFSSWELHSFGDLEIEIKNADGEIGSGTLGYNALNIYIDNTYPTLRLTDIQKIEETFHHIVSETMYYSQVVWSSLSDDERIILLEPYTIEIDNLNRIASSENSINNTYNKTRSISLLNCVNAKNVVGFYGNCMMLPFTFPKELAELIGKTAGDIQDELYRYHACNFRVPSTVVSIPTDGMVGEAVLGATNVSEKIDITRFWNWKDSDIDHIDLNQSSLNGRSLLENASTREVNAPTVGVTPTEHINGNNLAAALIARQQPTFADVYQNTDMRDVMKNADNNASAGREQIIKTNAELTKAALDAAVKAGEAALTGGASGALGGAGGALSGSSLTGLVDTLGKLGFNDSDILKSITNGDGTIEGIFKAAAGLSKGTSGTSEGTIPSLTNALKSFGGEELKQFLSNFANNATNGQSLEESFKNSFSNITGTDKDVTINDILSMSNEFCSENNINLSDFTSALGKALGLF